MYVVRPANWHCPYFLFFLNLTLALNSSGWAKEWKQSDFELLCADGHRAALSEWESCNLGVVPPNSIMTRPVLTARVYDFLMKSQVSNFVYIKSHSFQFCWEDLTHQVLLARLEKNPTLINLWTCDLLMVCPAYLPMTPGDLMTLQE